MPGRTRAPQQTPDANNEDEIIITDDDQEVQPDNSALQSLVMVQLSRQPEEKASAIVKAARTATLDVFEVDNDSFGGSMDTLDGALGAFSKQLGAITKDAGRIDKLSADVDLDAEILGDLVGKLDEGDEAFDTAFDPAKGLGFWLWPTEYKGQRLVGMYGRETSLPETEEIGAAGVKPWITWAGARRSALQDLLDRADRVRTYAEEHASELAAVDSFYQIWKLADVGRPADLAAATGREYQYLLGVVQDEWPSWTVPLLSRSKADLMRESEAMDSGVDAEEVAELDELAAMIEDEELGLDETYEALDELGAAERAYVLKTLRWNAEGGDSRYADLLEDADEDQVELLDLGLGEEGLSDYNDAGTVGMDLARGAPGAVANVGYGMVRSLPILGDVLHHYAGEYVDGGIEHMNTEWLGMDGDMSDQQRVLGQVSGQIAGTIGLMGVAGPTAAAEGVAAKVPTAVRLGLFGADTANGAYQAATGETVTGEELPWWARVLAGVGVAANAGSAAKALKGAPDAVLAKGAAEASRKNVTEIAEDPALGKAMEDFLPGMFSRAADAEKAAKEAKAWSTVGQAATGMGRGGPVSKTLGEGLDEDEEREAFGIDNVWDTLFGSDEDQD